MGLIVVILETVVILPKLGKSEVRMDIDMRVYLSGLLVV